MKKRFLFGAVPALSVCLVSALFLFTPGSARAADFGVRGGAYSDETDPFVGAEVLFGMDQAKHWYGDPNVEYVMSDTSHDITAFSFDFHYDFPSGQPYGFWAGAGPTLIHRNDTDANANDAGLNLLVGVGAKKGNVRPYGQLKAVVADDNEVVLGVGVRF
jgi:hypothetical protein